MLSYSEILPKEYIVLDGEPYEVIAAQITKKQRQKPSNQTKLKSLSSGKVIEKAFHQSDVVEEAEIEKRKIRYLYTNRGEVWFCDPDNPRDRFSLNTELIGEKSNFLKENMIVDVSYFNEVPIALTLPIKIELSVTEAPPTIRGNTSQGGTKQVTLETGAVVSVPLFIREGDIVRVNTETGEYVERAEKK